MTHIRHETGSPFRVARRVGSVLNATAGVLFVFASIVGAQLHPGDGNLIWLAAGVLTLGYGAALWAIAHPDAIAGYRETALGRELSVGDAAAEAEHERLMRADDLQMAEFFERTEPLTDISLPLSSDPEPEQSVPDWELESDDDRRWMPPESAWNPAAVPSDPVSDDAVPDDAVSDDAVPDDAVPDDAVPDDTVPLQVRRNAPHAAPVVPPAAPPASRWAPPTSTPYPDPAVRAPVDLPAWASAARQRSARHRTGAGRRRLTG